MRQSFDYFYQDFFKNVFSFDCIIKTVSTAFVGRKWRRKSKEKCFLPQFLKIIWKPFFSFKNNLQMALSNHSRSWKLLIFFNKLSHKMSRTFSSCKKFSQRLWKVLKVEIIRKFQYHCDYFLFTRFSSIFSSSLIQSLTSENIQFALKLFNKPSFFSLAQNKS